MEQDARERDFRNFRETAAEGGGGPDDHGKDNGSAEDVWLEGEIFVTETGADEDLEKYDEGVERDDGVDRGRTAVLVLRKALHVPVTSEEGDADEDGKHDFGSTGVHDRKPVVQKFENGEATEDSLKNHATESGEAELLHPGALFVTPEEEGKNDDQEAQTRGDETVGVFERDAADHRGIQGAVGERPIGDGKSGVFGGDERTGGEENGRVENDEEGVFVNARMVRSHHEFRAPNPKNRL